MAAYLVDDLVVVVVVEVAVVRKGKWKRESCARGKLKKFWRRKLGPAKKACQEWGPWLIR